MGVECGLLDKLDDVSRVRRLWHLSISQPVRQHSAQKSDARQLLPYSVVQFQASPPAHSLADLQDLPLETFSARYVTGHRVQVLPASNTDASAIELGVYPGPIPPPDPRLGHVLLTGHERVVELAVGMPTRLLVEIADPHLEKLVSRVSRQLSGGSVDCHES